MTESAFKSRVIKRIVGHSYSVESVGYLQKVA